MATLTIELPAVVKLTNVSENAIPFQPYHENFPVQIPAGQAVEFEVETCGQFFYYEKQAKDTGLTFEQLQAVEEEPAEGTIVIDLPSLVTLKNVEAFAVAFRPYRENFDVKIGVGDEIVLEAKTAGQVLYYLAQAQVNKGIEITFAAKA